MRSSVIRLVTTTITAVLITACAGRPPTPPPAEPYTSFATAELKVKSDPDWLTVGFGSIWVKRPEGFVDRIDARAATISAEIQIHETRPEACEGIGSGATALWSCDLRDVVRIDPSTNEVAATIPAEKIPGQGRLVTAGGRIWVLAGNGDRLVGIDEATSAIGDPIPLPAACGDLGAMGEVIYVVCESAGRVLRVDLADGSVTAEAQVTGPNWVSAAASGVWVAAGNDLLRLDPRSLAPTVTVPGMGTGQLGSIWADASGVWVRKVDPFLTRIDTSGSIGRTISAPFRTGGDVVGDGGTVWVTAIDERLVIRLDIPTGT